MSNDNKSADSTIATTSTSENKYLKMMAEMKKEMKKLSHNELSRHYVHLFTQYVLEQRKCDELYKQLNEINLKNTGSDNV